MQSLQTLADRLVDIVDADYQLSLVIEAEDRQLLVYLSEEEPTDGPLNTLWLNTKETSSLYKVFQRKNKDGWTELTEYDELFEFPVWEGDTIYNPSLEQMADHIAAKNGINVHGLTAASVGAIDASYQGYLQRLYSNVSGRVNLNLSDIYSLQEQLNANVLAIASLSSAVAELNRKASISMLAAKHVQETVEMEWLVEHDLGKEGVKLPNVVCTDSLGNAMMYDSITPIDTNSLIITFSMPIKGRAYIMGR